jgi:hypothetical protein
MKESEGMSWRRLGMWRNQERTMFHMLKRRMPYGIKICGKFRLERGGAICEKLRILGEKRVLKKIVHCSNRESLKILGDYLLKVTKILESSAKRFDLFVDSNFVDNIEDR